MQEDNFYTRHPLLTLVSVNLLVLLSILFLFELGLRIYTPKWLSYRMQANKSIPQGFGTDTYWKIKYKNNKFYSYSPNSVFRVTHFEYDKAIHINSLGGRICSATEIEDTVQIIPFIGDSYVFGVGVEDTETVVAVAKKITKYNFLNLGVSGTCLSQQRRILADRYNELGRPKVVIYGFYLGNDFPCIIRLNSETQKRDKRKILGTTEHNNRDAKKVLNDFLRSSYFLRNSYSIQYIKYSIWNIRNRESLKDMPAAYAVMDRRNTEYISNIRKYLDMEISSLKKEPYESVFIVFPDRYQVDDSLRAYTNANNNIDERNIDPMLPNKILIETLRQYNISYIDVTPELLKHKNISSMFFQYDPHMTSLGHYTAGVYIAPQLRKILSEFYTIPN